MMDDVDQALFRILVEHDVAINERDQQRGLVEGVMVWPDLSDIHTKTRERIRNLVTSFDKAEVQRVVKQDVQ